MKRKRKHNPKPKMLYSRATAVVFNPAGEVLLVKHNGENKWALAGGRTYAGEDLGHRAALEVAEETGSKSRISNSRGVMRGRWPHTLCMLP